MTKLIKRDTKRVALTFERPLGGAADFAGVGGK
jgi:hypothetical protein